MIRAVIFGLLAIYLMQNVVTATLSDSGTWWLAAKLFGAVVCALYANICYWNWHDRQEDADTNPVE